ncbi:MAG: polysaccharide biosynthesis/export family protein [Rhizomicrobium sp.]
MRTEVPQFFQVIGRYGFLREGTAMRATFLSILLVLAALAIGAAATPVRAQTTASIEQTYRLGAGDKVQVNVFGQPDLSGDFVVDGTGFVQLPLIGQVKASGLSIREFETEVANALRNGQYLKDPRVSVEVVNYRPFYIIGEVNKPGEYPYVNDMSVLNAIALAGGYTFRADDSVVYIRRNGEPKENRYSADQNTRVAPGDIIRVGERFF